MTLRSGRLPFQVRVVENPARVTAHAGLPLVIEAFRTLGLREAVYEHLGFKQRTRDSSACGAAPRCRPRRPCGRS